MQYLLPKVVTSLIWFNENRILIFYFSSFLLFWLANPSVIFISCVHFSAHPECTWNVNAGTLLIHLSKTCEPPHPPLFFVLPICLPWGEPRATLIQTLTKRRFLWGRKEAEDSMAKNNEVERTECGRSLTWCWHLAHPVDERRATGDPGRTGRPGVGLSVGNDPQLCLDCEGKMPLTQSAQIWPRGLQKRKINEHVNELSSSYQLLNNI